MLININEIKINEGRRTVTSEAIQGLTESIREIGMMNPVTVTADHTLIAGLHRLEAAKVLGWEEIECHVIDADDLHAELAEIDENYVRASLTPLESSKLMLRRKEIYETLHPETKAGTAQGEGMRRAAAETGSRDLADNLSARSPAPARPFAEDTADKLGVDARTVRRQVQIAKDLTPEVQDLIEQSDHKFTQQDLIKLSRLNPEQQKEAADWIISKKVRSVGDYLQQKKYAKLAAEAETVVVEDPNLPFKIESKRFHSFEESVADMKNLDKDCSYTPDMFMAEITRSIEDFRKVIQFYRDPIYTAVFPSVTAPQLAYLRERADEVRAALDGIIKLVENPGTENDNAKEEEAV